MLTADLIERVLTALPRCTIGVIGDLFLDRYLDIDPALNEPSVETGLTAYQVVRVRSYPGAAGTVINNLAALGAGRIVPIAFVGDDGEGYELRQALARLQAVEQSGITLVPDRHTPTYTKPMLGSEELNRLDIKNRTPTSDAIQDAILKSLDDAWPRFDALIVLDQVSEPECGVVTQRVRERLAQLAESDPAKFVLADSRKQIGRFRNVCVKPNVDEAFTAFVDETHEDPWRYNDGAMAVWLAERCGRTVFCTSGEYGIVLAQPTCEPFTVQTHPVTGPIDICGAGDSCSAGITSAMVAGLTHEQAAAFGNLVASITIQQIGVTGTASTEQVRQRWRVLHSEA